MYDINELNRLEETYSDEMWPKLWKRPVVLVKQKQGVDVPLIVDTHIFAAFAKKIFLML